MKILYRDDNNNYKPFHKLIRKNLLNLYHISQLKPWLEKSQMRKNITGGCVEDS